MNKEVIYLEPEDDITDILTKLQRAEQKLVALVPPKKATMLRSAVNMKLVARAAKECDKVAVIVTSDPAIVKLAMAAQIPVAKTLQSRPVVPTPEMIKESEKSEQVIDEGFDDSKDKNELDSLKDKKTNTKTSGEASKSSPEKFSDKSAATLDLTDENLVDGEKNAKKSNKKDDKNKKVPSFDKYRKFIIFGVLAAVILIVFGVWAFVFAPFVKITVAMSTSSSNFSEDVSFNDNNGAADPTNGVFFVEKQSFEQKYTGEIAATGKENRGEKASGKVTIAMTFTPTLGASAQIGLAKGQKLKATTAEGKLYTYILEEDYSTTYDGSSDGISAIEADGWSCPRTIISGSSKCTKTIKTASVTAEKSGEEYNIGAGSTWDSMDDDDETIRITNTNSISGGTTNEVSFVSQADLDKAKDEILSSHQVEGRNELLSQLKGDSDIVVIEASFSSEAGDVTSKPAVNAELSSDSKPEATVNVTYSVYTVSKSQIEEFIKAKAEVADDQRIYSIGDPYFERFTSISENAKLKTVIKTGPTVTEEDILEKAKGKKIGEVQSLLRSINGVSSVNIEPSYFWVWSVPNDPSKISIDLTVEDN